MDLIRDLVRNIALIILLASFVDLLLPGRKMERYLKLIIGLFVIVTVLNPIMSFLGKSQNFEITAWQYQPADQRQLDSIFQQGKEVAQVTKDAAWDDYKQRVERQIISIVSLVSRVKEVQVDVSFENREENYYGSIRRVVLVAVIENSEETVSDADDTGSNIKVEPVKQVKIEQEKQLREKVQDREQLLLTTQERKTIEAQIRRVVCDFYGLQEDQITVTAVAGEAEGGEIDG